MTRASGPKVVTANALLEGDAIWQTEAGTWTRDIREAELLTDEAHAQIRLIDAMMQADRVVGAYLADATAGPDGPEPVHFREAFRTRGPSNYSHGKQSERRDV